jgi:serine O-acetyltransferase
MDSHLPQIVEDLLDSYRNVGGINNIDGSNLPSKRALAVLCADLLQLLFPGFHDQEVVHSGELLRSTGSRVESFFRRLHNEVCKSLRLGRPDCPEREAKALVLHMLDSLPVIREVLWSDVEAAFEGDPASSSFDEIILAYPCLEAIAIQRCAHTLYRQKVPLIPRMMTEWAHSRTGIDIHPGAHIGTHFFIDHGTGVVIGETCVIGSHVKLYHGVTLGAKSFQKDEEGRILKGGKRHPNVENNVTIYPNSTVLGGETVIGENSTIGGNVFLQHSVPANSLVYYEETQLKIMPKKNRESISIPGGSAVVSGRAVVPKGGLESWCDWSI